ncbi:unnamed protein product [Protopolystoma xenopodis]|uniref:Uncharacterized protein n=1 Tax=Protopolystoma xenopodis TaxID=117903 RepID=A0A448WL24_9PLAT|nr:unnamed protein product [Protopolystoma xenopodis]
MYDHFQSRTVDVVHSQTFRRHRIYHRQGGLASLSSTLQLVNGISEAVIPKLCAARPRGAAASLQERREIL